MRLLHHKGLLPATSRSKGSLTTLFWQTKMMTNFSRFGMFLCVALCLPCYGQITAPDIVRDRLTLTELLTDDIGIEGPIHNGYFMPIGPVEKAKNELLGTLTIPKTEFRFGFFPAISFQVFSHQGHLLPVIRDIIRTEGSLGNIILSPGRVWSEPSDNGYSRASFPFVLTHPVWNAAHNGLATFVYDDAEISSLVFQIAQETSPDHKFDSWGRLPVTLERGEIESRNLIANEYELELKERLPIRSWSDLEDHYGPRGAVVSRLWPETEDESVSGLVIDDTIFIRSCRTRFGPYPYCDEMRHGVYSMTKSLGAMLSMLRLAQKYGDDVFGLKIRDYVEVTAEHNGWDEVMFADALNMVTGIGDAPGGAYFDFYQHADSTALFEDGDIKYSLLMYSKSKQEKLEVAFTSSNYPWGPGEMLRYRSIDTFILAAAMDSYLKSREGQSANIWDMVIDEVLRPIGVFHAPMMHTEEPDGGRGIPILGEGIFPTFHDIAKIGGLLQNNGRHEGVQLLSPSKLDEALYRTNIRGKPTPENHYRLPNFTYHMSLWHFSLELSGCTVDVANMFGYGTNIAQLLPFGMVTFYLQDGHHQGHRELANATNQLRPFCTSDGG